MVRYGGRRNPSVEKMVGDDRLRTADIFGVNEALYQLS